MNGRKLSNVLLASNAFDIKNKLVAFIKHKNFRRFELKSCHKYKAKATVKRNALNYHITYNWQPIEFSDFASIQPRSKPDTDRSTFRGLDNWP